MIIERLDAVAGELAFLPTPPMFFGAAVLPLYLDDLEKQQALVRPTEDVDVVISLPKDEGSSELKAISRLERQLSSRGFEHDTRSHRGNIDAWITPSGIPVDLVLDLRYSPDDWPLLSRASAQARALPSGRSARVPAPEYYLCCKIAASREPKRWDGPYYSQDIPFCP